MKKLLSIIAGVFIIGSAVGCGSTDQSSQGPGSGANAGLVSAQASVAAPAYAQALAEGLSDFSPADLNAVATFTPAAVGLPGIDAGPSWRRLLDPRPRLSFGRARAQTQAPAEAFSYYVDDGNTPPDCATQIVDESCTDGSATCTVSLAFAPACPIIFNNGNGHGMGNGHGNGNGNGNGHGQGRAGNSLLMEGRIFRALTQTVPASAPGSQDGAWSQTVTTTNLITTDPHTGRWLIFNGSITQTFDGSSAAAPYQFQENISIPAETPTAVVNDRGDKLAVYGSSEIKVLPGSSAESQSDLYMLLLGTGNRSRSIRRQVQLTLTMLTPTTMAAEIHSQNSALSNGESWKRDGQFTIEQLDERTVMVNGSNVIVGPDGVIYDVRLTDVVFEDGALAPLSGSATISIDGVVVATVTFNGECRAQMASPDGTVSGVDICSAGSVMQKIKP